MLGDGEGFSSGEALERRSGEEEGAEVVGVCGGEMVAGIDCFFHEAATLLAAPDGVFVVKSRRCASHCTATQKEEEGMEMEWWGF